MKVYYKEKWQSVEIGNPILTELSITIKSGAYIGSGACISEVALLSVKMTSY